MQLESATPKTLNSLDKNLVGVKVRVAGRLLTYDGETAFALIFNEAVAIVVDASYSIDASCKTWINEPLGAVMIIGYLEEREADELPMLKTPTYTPAVTIKPSLLLRALLVTPALDLNLMIWNQAIQDREDVLRE